MTEKTPKPLINVKETARNFRMTDCEFQMGDSARPVLETKAENTRVEGTKVTIHRASNSGRWSDLFWKVLVPLAVAVVGGVLVYLLVGR